MKFFFLLLFAFPVFSQTQLLDIKIDAITSKDTIDNEREYTINYHIENKIANEVSFFLKPTSLIPAHYGSMGTSTLFKLYQENEILENDDILDYNLKKNIITPPDFSFIKDEKQRALERRKFFKENYNIDLDSISIKNTDLDLQLKNTNKNLMNSICLLQPKEVKKYSYTFYWDKTRYYKQGVMEYYLNEKSKFYMEFLLVLMKEHYKDKLLPEEFIKIMNNKNFIQGVYVSNKVEIDFGE